jgi:hypothetical protein
MKRSGVFGFLISLAALPVAAQPADSTKPFFRTYCISCHGPDKAKGDIRLDALRLPIRNDDDAEMWHRVMEALQFGEMPPDNAKKFPTRPEARSIEKQIAGALASRGSKLTDKSTTEGYGNLVPHDLLFSPEERHRSVDVGARIWRISPQTLASTIHATGLREFIGNPFAHDKPDGKFRDFKGKYLMNSVVTEQLLELVMQATETQLKELQKKIDSADDRDQAVRAALVKQFHLALRRNPTDEDLARAEALMRKVEKEIGPGAGLQAALASVILLPESIFRYETIDEAQEPEERGLIPLSRSELADALSFSLTDLPPRPELTRTFEDERRPVSEILRTEAASTLRSDRRAHAHLLKFLREYFDYEKCQEVFKDKATQHHHDGAALVGDLDRLIKHVLQTDRQVFRTLLTTSEFFVQPTTALSWNQPPGWKISDKLVALPPDQRKGVLTHPAWLVAHSGNFDNDPIHRGLWVQRKLLGGNVPDIPITVDARLPDEPTWTLRKRLQVTRAEQCYKCHSKMNPLGLPFEQFDHFGRYRVFEFDTPVETTGAFPHTGVPALQGEVSDPFELIDKLAESTHVEQVFVRHVFRFFMGRNETLGDARTLQDAHKAYVGNDGSMKAMVVSLLASDSFIYRAAPREGR